MKLKMNIDCEICGKGSSTTKEDIINGQNRFLCLECRKLCNTEQRMWDLAERRRNGG